MAISFLLKLWLSAPFGIGILVLTFFKFRENKNDSIKSFCLFLTIYLLTCSGHLLITYLNSPEDVVRWLREVYFSPFFPEIAGRSKSTYVEGWSKPFYYYVYILVRDYAGTIPFFIIAGLELFKFKKNKLDDLDYSMIFTFLSFFIFSFVSIKDPKYILPSLFAGCLITSKLYSSSKINKAQFKKISITSLFPLVLFIYIFYKRWSFKNSESSIFDYIICLFLFEFNFYLF